MESISAGMFAVLAAVLGYLFWRCSRQVRGLESRYSGIIDLDAELKSRRIAFDAGLQTERSQLEGTRKATETQLATVKSQIKEAEGTLRSAAGRSGRCSESPRKTGQEGRRRFPVSAASCFEPAGDPAAGFSQADY